MSNELKDLYETGNYYCIMVGGKQIPEIVNLMSVIEEANKNSYLPFADLLIKKG